eukprot:TRINITY_DN297_c0_g1_i2.p1 TRINITY_DN297_c0_g1~~TRINITY_DN297_c0_g1_i2.p1  ORF type:complete len:111 (-),score=15.72 TRINITY_DN297_c0_g1_i2:30-362(-)
MSSSNAKPIVLLRVKRRRDVNPFDQLVVSQPVGKRPTVASIQQALAASSISDDTDTINPHSKKREKITIENIQLKLKFGFVILFLFLFLLILLFFFHLFIRFFACSFIHS